MNASVEPAPAAAATSQAAGAVEDVATLSPERSPERTVSASTRAPSVCESEISLEDMRERERRRRETMQTSVLFGRATSAPNRFAGIAPFQKAMPCGTEDLGADVVEAVVPDDLPCFSVTSDASTGQSAGTATFSRAVSY
jgi:hypothetical protein